MNGFGLGLGEQDVSRLSPYDGSQTPTGVKVTRPQLVTLTQSELKDGRISVQWEQATGQPTQQLNNSVQQHMEKVPLSSSQKEWGRGILCIKSQTY